jgi:hypothetical protein
MNIHRISRNNHLNNNNHPLEAPSAVQTIRISPQVECSVESAADLSVHLTTAFRHLQQHKQEDARRKVHSNREMNHRQEVLSLGMSQINVVGLIGTTTGGNLIPAASGFDSTGPQTSI